MNSQEKEELLCCACSKPLMEEEDWKELSCCKRGIHTPCLEEVLAMSSNYYMDVLGLAKVKNRARSMKPVVCPSSPRCKNMWTKKKSKPPSSKQKRIIALFNNRFI